MLQRIINNQVQFRQAFSPDSPDSPAVLASMVLFPAVIGASADDDNAPSVDVTKA
jgi:hypothetical protein